MKTERYVYNERSSDDGMRAIARLAVVNEAPVAKVPLNEVLFGDTVFKVPAASKPTLAAG